MFIGASRVPGGAAERRGRIEEDRKIREWDYHKVAKAFPKTDDPDGGKAQSGRPLGWDIFIRRVQGS